MPTSLEDPPAPSLEYARAAAPVTRRHFRILLFLTLLNTILLGTFVCGPAVSLYVRTRWEIYQAQRALHKQQQAQADLAQQASAFTEPADTIVYEEDPIEAAKLLALNAAYANIPNANIVHLTPKPWQPPVYRTPTAFISTINSTFPNSDSKNCPTLFLHSLKNSRGEERLIWIILMAQHRLRRTEDNGFGAPASGILNFTATTNRMLEVRLIKSSGPDGLLDSKSTTNTFSPTTPGNSTTVTWTNTGTWENGRIDFKTAGQFRFYAGQSDPADPSHFTIDYTLDGKRNTIDGYLKANDRILFVPRAGRIIDVRGNDQFWNPYAAPAP